MDMFSKIINFHVTVFSGVLLICLIVWATGTLVQAVTAQQDTSVIELNVANTTEHKS